MSLFLRLILLASVPLMVIVNLGADEWRDPDVTLLSRTPKLKTFPCTKCHQQLRLGVFSENEKVKEHTGLTFKHMAEVRECKICHNPHNPDQLILADGTPVSYDEMPRVCGQCHGKIEYEWNRGMHGKQVGSWNGQKIRWMCAECHEPHAPKFRSYEAVATPFLSDYVIRKVKHK